MAWLVISASIASAVYVMNWPSPGGRGVFSTITAETMTADKRIEGTPQGRDHISEEQLLKVSKEVVIKFIEMGRITPTTFGSSFKEIHNTIRDTVKRG